MNSKTMENFNCWEVRNMQFIDLEKLNGHLSLKHQPKVDLGDEK